MKRAIQLAKHGALSTAPNPMVGAVVVFNGKIIGEGYHQKYGEAHAEVNAINAVNDKSLLKESTIYVSLEPCSHYGKTPPCADLIVEHRLKRVVIANLDPSEKVAGKGVEKLKAAGIEVSVGICAEEAQELNHRFFCLHQKQRPYVILKWASTADGFMGREASDPKTNDNWITSPLSKQKVHLWRAQEMGILVGKQTALCDNPELNVREVSGRNPTRFLIDPKLEVPNSAKIFNDQAATVILNQEKDGKDGKHTYLKFKDGELIARLFEYCVEEAIHSLIVEGGSETLKYFLADGRWDEIRHFVGKKRFEKGIPSPHFQARLVSTEKLRDDQLRIYKNPLI
jgi:diaminohydroxyphosphoribosylaminopyrimidine deaminase/5-amino-6-(5-phosphoribosylamino)uracil reductase